MNNEAGGRRSGANVARNDRNLRNNLFLRRQKHEIINSNEGKNGHLIRETLLDYFRVVTAPREKEVESKCRLLLFKGLQASRELG